MPVRQAAEREATRVPMSFRVTPALRAKLEDAASKSGRSLTAETEYRLQTSFEWERAFAAGMALNDDKVAAVRRRMAASVRKFWREGLEGDLPVAAGSAPVPSSSVNEDELSPEDELYAMLEALLETLAPLTKKMDDLMLGLERAKLGEASEASETDSM